MPFADQAVHEALELFGQVLGRRRSPSSRRSTVFAFWGHALLSARIPPSSSFTVLACSTSGSGRGSWLLQVSRKSGCPSRFADASERGVSPRLEVGGWRPLAGFHLPSCAPFLGFTCPPAPAPRFRVSPALLRPLPGFTCPPVPPAGFHLPSCALGFTCPPAPPAGFHLPSCAPFPGFHLPSGAPISGFTCPPAPPFLGFTCFPVPPSWISPALPWPPSWVSPALPRPPLPGFTCPPAPWSHDYVTITQHHKDSPRPETLPLVEDVERQDEHDVEPDHTKWPGGPGRGWGAGHSRVTGREAAQGTLDTRPRCLGAHKPTNNPEALQTRPRGLGIPCLPTLNLPTMKPLWCPARSNEDDDEEHLITQGGPGFPEKRGGGQTF